jgi:hypothetical protein
MRIGPAAARAQSGAIFTVLIGLGGFAAGALVMGLLTFSGQPAPAGVQTDALPAPVATPRDPMPPMTGIDGIRSWPAPGRPSDWAFEGASPAAETAPGTRRPDRLSAPEGWTYDRREAATDGR